MTRKPLTAKDVKKAAKLTLDELNFINDTASVALAREQRPIVYMALCSHLIGCVVAGSGGTLGKELVLDLVAKGVEV